MNDVFFKQRISPTVVVEVRNSEFERVKQLVEQDVDLRAELEDYRRRWIEAKLSDDANAFAILPSRFLDFCRIVESSASDKNASIVAMCLLLIFLDLEQPRVVEE